MSDFKSAINTVLEHEGGLVNNPRDPGGITNYGISLRYLKSLNDPRYDFDQDGDIDANDIKTMTRDEATIVYENEWWDRYKYGQIDEQGIATKLFDVAVNMGQSQAVKLMQRACNRCAPAASLIVDGILGEKTISIINSINQPALLPIFKVECANFYKGLVEKNPNLSEFLKGWLNRAYS